MKLGGIFILPDQPILNSQKLKLQIVVRIPMITVFLKISSVCSLSLSLNLYS